MLAPRPSERVQRSRSIEGDARPACSLRLREGRHCPWRERLPAENLADRGDRGSARRGRRPRIRGASARLSRVELARQLSELRTGPRSRRLTFALAGRVQITIAGAATRARPGGAPQIRGLSARSRHVPKFAMSRRGPSHHRATASTPHHGVRRELACRTAHSQPLPTHRGLRTHRPVGAGCPDRQSTTSVLPEPDRYLSRPWPYRPGSWGLPSVESSVAYCD